MSVRNVRKVSILPRQGELQSFRFVDALTIGFRYDASIAKSLSKFHSWLEGKLIRVVEDQQGTSTDSALLEEVQNWSRLDHIPKLRESYRDVRDTSIS